MISTRTAAQAIGASGAGLAVAWLDTRPGNDATGLTAIALFVLAGIVAALAGRRPWLTTVLVGGWVPLVEIPGGGDPAALIALAFAAAGAAAGGLASGARPLGQR